MCRKWEIDTTGLALIGPPLHDELHVPWPSGVNEWALPLSSELEIVTLPQEQIPALQTPESILSRAEKDELQRMQEAVYRLPTGIHSENIVVKAFLGLGHTDQAYSKAVVTAVGQKLDGLEHIKVRNMGFGRFLCRVVRDPESEGSQAFLQYESDADRALKILYDQCHTDIFSEEDYLSLMVPGERLSPMRRRKLRRIAQFNPLVRHYTRFGLVRLQEDSGKPLDPIEPFPFAMAADALVRYSGLMNFNQRHIHYVPKLCREFMTVSGCQPTSDDIEVMHKVLGVDRRFEYMPDVDSYKMICEKNRQLLSNLEAWIGRTIDELAEAQPDKGFTATSILDALQASNGMHFSLLLRRAAVLLVHNNPRIRILEEAELSPTIGHLQLAIL